MEFIANAEKKIRKSHFYTTIIQVTNPTQISSSIPPQSFIVKVYGGGFYLVWDLMCGGSFYLVWDPLYSQLCPLHSELLSLSFMTFN